jgi:hypothetical protein
LSASLNLPFWFCGGLFPFTYLYSMLWKINSSCCWILDF